MDYTSLIERLEKATVGDRDLSIAIPVGLGFEWNGRLSAEHPVAQWEHPDGRVLQDGAFSESIDAALSLIPEGWRYGIEQAGRFDTNDLTEAWCWPYEDGFEPDWMNGDEGYRSCPNSARAAHKETAIAVVIVALKARSLTQKETG